MGFVEETYDYIIEQVIASKSLREHLKNIGHKFSYSELITLIYNCGDTLHFKSYLFGKLREMELAEQLEGYENRINTINSIVDKIKYVTDCASGVYRDKKALLIECLDLDGNIYEVKCFNRLLALKESGKLDTTERIQIVDTDTSRVECYITINKEAQATYFLSDLEELSEPAESSLYIRIPWELKAGDKVKIAGDESDKIWVVCYDNDIPDALDKNLDFVDTSITVIEADKLDKCRDYKEQIDEIIAKRIKNLDENKSGSELDVISIHHEHISTVLIEKAE